MNYRRFESSDAEMVNKVAKKSWQNTYQDIFTTQFIDEFVDRTYHIDHLKEIVPLIDAGWTGFWVADVNDLVVGFAQVGYTSSQLEKDDKENKILLYRIYVYPEYLRKGVGSNLLDLVEQWVKSEQKDRYGCYCHKDNQLGLEFYQKKGFVNVPERDKSEDDELFFLKILEKP